VNLSDLQPIGASNFGEGLEEGKSLELSFTSATNTWNIVGPLFTDSFGPANLIASPPPDTILYQKPSALVPGAIQTFAIAARPFGAQPPEYVRGLRLIYVVEPSRVVDYYCAFGVPTLLTDSLPTSTISYTSFAVGGTIRATPAGGGAPVAFDLRGSTVTLTANPANGQVTTALTLVGRQLLAGGALSDTVTQFGTFSGTATTDGTETTYLGTLSSPVGEVSASQFGGWFFGPQGREAGFAFNVVVNLPDGARQVGAGAVTARR
jgi:hypothetical protein